MAELLEKTLQTRIINKNGTYADWSSSNLVLKKGEIALVQFTTATKDAKGNIIHVPTYLMKVGDGTNTFSSLNWLSAPASDVYDWAKKEKIGDVDLKSHPDIVALQGAIDGLKYDVSDTGEGFVTAVTQADGRIAVTKKEITVADIKDIAANYAPLGEFTTVKGQVGDHEARIGVLEGDVASLKNSVSGAMHFVGITTTNPATSGATVQVPKAEGEGTEAKASYATGDVVIYKVAASTTGGVTTPAHDIEFVNVDGGNTAASWVELGDVTDEQKRLSALETDVGEIQGWSSSIHTHDNKELLDTVTEDNVHKHDNKTVIDAITADDVAHWTAAYQDGNYAHTDQIARINAIYDYLGDGTSLADVLILDCGGVS